MYVNEYTLNLDLKKTIANVVPIFVAYDTATLYINVTDNGQPFDLSTADKYTLNFKRPDGVEITGNGTLENAMLKYQFGTSEMEVEGDLYVVAHFYQGSDRVSTKPFKVTIVGDVAEVIPTSDSLPLSQQLQADGAYARSQGDALGHKGSYSSTATYNANNIVTFNNINYICIQNTTAGIDPSNGTYWTQLSPQSRYNSQNWTATDNQTVFTLTNGSYITASNNIEVYVGGSLKVSGTEYTETNSTSFALSTGISSGTAVFARWLEGAVSISKTHHSTHEAGGQDELDVTKLKNYPEQIANKIGILTSLATTNKTDLVSAINENVNKIGNLTNLSTTAKTDLVSAINENANKISNASSSSTVGSLSSLTTTDKSSIVNAINENVNRINDNTTGFVVNLSDRKYGLALDGVTDDSVALQNALNLTLNGQMTKTVILPSKDIRITKTIEIPVRVSVVGMANARIIADYTNWTGGTDYRAIRVMTREGINYFTKEYNQKIANFKIIGKGNSTVQSIALDLSTDSTSITWEQVINYAVIMAHFENIYIDSFDTGLNVIESSGTAFNKIYVLDCRVGVNIKGKSVNLVFNEIFATNFTNANTSNTGTCIAVNVDSKMTYTDGEGRPEGISFNQCILFGADNILSIQRVLHMRVTDCILDGARQDTVQILGPNNVTIKGCYIYTGGAYCGINLLTVQATSGKINIIDNYFSGASVANNYGIYSSSTRTGITVRDNYFGGWSNPTYFNYFNECTITGNYGSGNSGALIYCQSNCKGTVIDGNVSDDSLPVVKLHPATDQSLKIGSNKSATYSTLYQGNVTMAAGATSAVVTNNLYSSEIYMRTITRVMPTGNLGSVWVSPETTYGQVTINCTNAPSSATQIFVECITIPYSAAQ